jgi:hypothetical protein
LDGLRTQIQPQRPGRFSNDLQRRAPIGRWVKKKADMQYPFELGEVCNYTLDGESIHPVTTKIQASFLTQLPERKATIQGFHHGDFKTEFNGCDRRKLRKKEACTEYKCSKTCILFAIRH